MTKEELQTLLSLSLSDDQECNQVAESIIINTVNINNIKSDNKLDINYLSLLLCLLEKYAYNHKMERNIPKTDFIKFLEKKVGLSFNISYGYVRVDLNKMKINRNFDFSTFDKENILKLVNHIYYSVFVEYKDLRCNKKEVKKVLKGILCAKRKNNK